VIATRLDGEADPLRAELFSVDQLRRHAAVIARRHKMDSRHRPDRLLRRLAVNERVLLAGHALVSQAAAGGRRVALAAEWLLDNFYLIEQQIVLARRHLPPGYSRELPQLSEGPSVGYPRVYDMALELISHVDGRVDQETIAGFVAAYQSVHPLGIGELWAFPIMLRLALIENLRRVVSRIARRRKDRDAAIAWTDRLIEAADKEPQRLTRLLAELAEAHVTLTAPFVEEFTGRLQGQGPAVAFVLTWAEQQLVDRGTSVTQLLQVDGRTQGADRISMGNSVSSLALVSAMNWRDFVETASVVEAILRDDPTGVYEGQDFATRNRYRRSVEEIASGGALGELEVAREAVRLAEDAASRLGIADREAHVGYVLVDHGRRALERAARARSTLSGVWDRLNQGGRLAIYLAAILLVMAPAAWSALFELAPPFAANGYSWLLMGSGLIAVSALAVSIVNLFVTWIVPPRALPRLDLSKGITAAHRTLVVVPTLLGDATGIAAMLDALEIRFLGNRDPDLFFALLTDFHDAPERSLPGDAELLDAARTGIAALNVKHGGRQQSVFFLFHRTRTWNPHERLWMGYERKRGKLEQLNAFLRGGASDAFSEVVGDLSILPKVKYVITLDTDTQLPRDSARKLIGNLAHPLNRPVYDAKRGRVVSGYAILQPRVSISLESAGRSRFARLASGESGIDPYTHEVSDVYQDLFGEGSFVGKGIYDVDAFRAAVEGRFPENLVLSHDLLEGGYARAALVTDVELIEEQPSTVIGEANRRHRWIRGDWQIAAWILPRVPGPDGRWSRNPLTALSIWKIADNLRRTLVPPSLFALLVGGWILGTGATLSWSLLVVGVVFLSTLLSAFAEFTSKPAERAWPAHANVVVQSAARPLARAGLALALLPYDALISVDAIVRSGVRMAFTRRGLFLWHPRYYARRNARSTLLGFHGDMWIGPVAAGALAGTMASTRPLELPFVAPILLLWLASPLIGYWMSQRLETATVELGAERIAFLRGVARRTWRYFADFASAGEGWLPPDNVQETPSQTIASRTSPTNMGMALLANLAAYDFGYISASRLLKRTELAIGAMESLDRFRGHFYNWYDTRSLQPLAPFYVSSVDSGNLAGSLITLSAGLAELADASASSPSARSGLEDTVKLLASTVPPDASELLPTIARIEAALARAPAEADDGGALVHEIRRLATGLPDMFGLDAGEEQRAWASALIEQCEDFLDDLTGRGSDAVWRARIEALSKRCDALREMDFEFLYDRSRDLLAIGYDVTGHRRDPGCYDLLASEARLVSFVLIAQGQVPQEHWFSLGRSLTSHRGDFALISWSGSMFEYLMPDLLMPTFPDTLLHGTAKAVVSRQIEYGAERGVPWGISESCYSAVDARQVYQYRAFGVPGLGLKRGLADDLVIAPYATLLASGVAPRESCRNLQALAANGCLGRYGFYEAVDYTPSRLARRNEPAIVRTFMAHHQGMGLAALDNLLNGRPMPRRFMADPQMRATEPLLQERIPKSGTTLIAPTLQGGQGPRGDSPEEPSKLRVFNEPDTPMPEVNLLSNGRYHVMTTHAGGGYARWRDLAVTRWREDATRDSWGTFVYLRDRDLGRFWSAAHQPTRRKADRYEAVFGQARAEFRRRDHEIEAYTELAVSPEDDVEIRRVTLTNLSRRPRYIEITSYAEVVLAPLNADLAHRSFSNLFVTTEVLADRQAILCSRRKRSPEEAAPWMFHLLIEPGVSAPDTSYETDRARFLGRGRGPDNPAAMDPTCSRLSGTAGTVLDPIVAIRRTVAVAPDVSVAVQIVSGACATREEALALIGKYRDHHFVERAFDMAAARGQAVLRQLSATEADSQAYERLAASVVHATALHRAPPGIIARNRLGQSRLWRFGVSGDLPIVLVRICHIDHIELVEQALRCHAYWRIKGLIADLVILNEDFSGYRAVLHDRIMGIIQTGPAADLVDKPGGIFVRRAEQISEEDRVLFQTVARVILLDTAGSFADQSEKRAPADRAPARFPRSVPAAAEPVVPLQDRERVYFNGLGGFTADGREYAISLEPGSTTPAPWSNVIASPHIGTVVSESGGAYTWVGNAHEFRLTPWHNDPVSDPTGEAFYIRDEETGSFWSPSPLPAKGRSGYDCRHGFGYSVFEHLEGGIGSELTIFVAMDAPVKLAVFKLRNLSDRPRRISLTGYFELVLGEWRHANLMHVVTETDPQRGTLLARNAYGRAAGDRIVAVDVSEASRTATGNRAEFIGRNGTLADPEAMRRVKLSGRTGASLDPCAALQAYVDLDVGEEREIVFTLAAAGDVAEARALSERFCTPVGARQALEAVWLHWNHTLGAIHVETPDRALDVMANGWLVYQTLSCRVWGRSGYYQSGGAYGFRDQLQDTMALVHAAPFLAKEQLVRCAGRQFALGDVQHWWHPPGGHGVRTHFSDDFLWLPYATCHYVAATGDTGVLDLRVPFLEGRAVDPDEQAYYDQPQPSSKEATVYEHCVRAIEHGLRFGEHGLPLMGCGDWNDGMDLVGRGGKGESVWLGWFLYRVLLQFAELARTREDPAFALTCDDQAERLRRNIEAHAWDGEWYRRAYFDDGTPLGSAASQECRIDAISQSWAVLSGGGDPVRARSAMAAVDKLLVMPEARLVKLLAPPFDTSSLEPGYIKGYGPGVRENGGQYTHAAVWTAMARAVMGDTDRAWELFAMLNPIHHAGDPAAAASYKVEPYVMAGDIHAAPFDLGRGGWTWYTGASGWMYRLIVETLLGLNLESDRLRFDPHVPEGWESYIVHYRHGASVFHIRFKRVQGGASGVLRVITDGVEQPAASLPLVDDGREHDVEVELGR
jgi:cyclic beta-1,2-glucan synthetase